MRNVKVDRIRVVDAMVIALILMLSGVSNVCSGQKLRYAQLDFEFNQDFSIDSKTLNSAYIEYNGTLKSISKSSPEYKKLIDKGTLFKYKGT